MDDIRRRIVDLRAEAIAVSELGDVENLLAAMGLLEECSELFKKILPLDSHFSPEDIRSMYAWEAREWALLCESMGIISGQMGSPEALNYFAQAKRFFVDKDDLDRLERNRKIIGRMLKELKEAGLIPYNWSKESIDLYSALRLITPNRQGFDLQAVTEFASAYNLKRQFALQAGQEILCNYADVVRRRLVPKRPLFDPEGFEFQDPIVQLAFWVDSLLHNCRGALETLAHIVNYVYQLGLKERDVTFFKSLKTSETAAVGMHELLRGIYDDTWFTIINRLRNRSYHVVLNTFIPKIGLGPVTQRYTIRFPIDPTKGKLTHRTLDSFLEAGYTFNMASMELAEFAHFITVRLEEYLSQVDAVIVDDCTDISEGRVPRSESIRPKLVISKMELHSWRNLMDVDYRAFVEIESDEDLE